MTSLDLRRQYMNILLNNNLVNHFVQSSILSDDDLVPGSVKTPIVVGTEGPATTLSNNNHGHTNIMLSPNSLDVNLLYKNLLRINCTLEGNWTLSKPSGASGELTVSSFDCLITPKSWASFLSQLEISSEGNSIYSTTSNQLEQMIILNSLPNAYVSTVNQYFNSDLADMGYRYGWLYHQSGINRVLTAAEISGTTIVLENGWSLKAQFVGNLQYLMPALSNIAAIFWNMGKLQLTIHINKDIYSSLYYYILPYNTKTDIGAMLYRRLTAHISGGNNVVSGNEINISGLSDLLFTHVGNQFVEYGHMLIPLDGNGGGSVSISIMIGGELVKSELEFEPTSWNLYDNGIELKLYNVSITSPDKQALIAYCANQRRRLPTLRFDTYTASTTHLDTKQLINARPSNIDKLYFIYSFDRDYIDFCPNPWIEGAIYSAGSLPLNASAESSVSLKSQEENIEDTTDSTIYGINKEFLASMNLNYMSTTPLTALEAEEMLVYTKRYIGSNYMRCFLVEPNNAWMKGINSNGSSLVDLFSVLYINHNYPYSAIATADYNVPDTFNAAIYDNAQMYLTALSDCYLVFTYNSLGISTGALFSFNPLDVSVNNII